MGKENERASNNSKDFSFWLDKLTNSPSKPHDVQSHLNPTEDLPPTPNSTMPEGNPTDAMLPSLCHQILNNNALKDFILSVDMPSNKSNSDQKEAINVEIIDPNDPECDELEDKIEATPLARTSIDESDLPTLDQEIFLANEEKFVKIIETPDDDPEESSLSIDQNTMNEFEHAFDNHAHKEIINHYFFENFLLFEIIAVGGSKMHLPCSVLK